MGGKKENTGGEPPLRALFQTKETMLLDLPDDVLAAVAAKCSQADRARLAQACTKTRDVALRLSAAFWSFESLCIELTSDAHARSLLLWLGTGHTLAVGHLTIGFLDWETNENLDLQLLPALLRAAGATGALHTVDIHEHSFRPAVRGFFFLFFEVLSARRRRPPNE